MAGVDGGPPPPVGSGARVLIDLNGVLEVAGSVVPGAPEVLEQLRSLGFAITVFTNTTTQSRRRLAERMVQMGLIVMPTELHTAAEATARHLLSQCDGASVLLHGAGEPFADHPNIAVSRVGDDLSGRLDAAVLGGADPDMTLGSFEVFFDQVRRRRLPLIAMHQNCLERRADRFGFDSGVFAPFIAQVCDTEPMLVGKPSAAFFQSAVGSSAARTVMVVGDDLISDVAPANALGYTSVLVTKTGKPVPHGATERAAFEIEDVTSLLQVVAMWVASSSTPCSAVFAGRP